MIERLHLSAVLLTAALLWAVFLLLDGVTLSVYWLRPFSAIMAIVLMLLTVFDLWVWRLRWLHLWFVKRPVVAGTWRVELNSNWKDPQTEQSIGPIIGCMVVRQTFSRISLRLITQESRSELLGAEILRADDGTYRIVGVYRNEPNVTVRQRSAIHYGGVVLQVGSARPARVEGHYWTDRNTAGDMVLSDARVELVEDWAGATRLYGFE